MLLKLLKQDRAGGFGNQPLRGLGLGDGKASEAGDVTLGDTLSTAETNPGDLGWHGWLSLGTQSE